MKFFFLKNKRFTSRILLIFFIISSASLGFCSFIYTEEIKNNFNVNFETGNLVAGEVIFSNLHYEGFILTKDGVLKDDIFSNHGSINIAFNIDKHNIEKYAYLVNGYINLEANLDTKLIKFSESFVGLEINITNAIISNTSLPNQTIIKSSISLPYSRISNAEVKLTYNFEGNFVDIYEEISALQFSIKIVR